MEIDTNERLKAEAQLKKAKQKLARFRQKKTKSQPVRTDEGGDESDTSFASTVSGGDEDDLEDRGLKLEMEVQSERRLKQASLRITELEESLTGKQTALDQLLAENGELKAQISLLSSVDNVNVASDEWLQALDLPVPASEALSTVEEYSAKLREFELALVRRDDVIRTLSADLRTTTENRDSLQAEYMTQASQLVEQVQILQDQLKQAGQWLQNQMGEHSVSAQALVDAKNELLALQEIVHQKDAEISLLHNTMRQRDDEIQQLVARLDAATRDYTLAHEESRQLHLKVRQCEEALVTQRAEHSAMLNELHGESAVVERESARLALERLHKEIEELRRRETENAEVVGRLMADVEAGHRSVVHPFTLATAVDTYTKEEHDADVERQLLALRAELEEMFGEDISRMKEQMTDHHSATVDQLRRDLARSEEERSRSAGQASLWQQQYMALSQQGVSNVDISQQLNDAIADSVQQRQRVAELTAQVEQLNARLTLSVHLPRSSSETSYELEEYKREIAEKIGAESYSLRIMLNDVCEDRDRTVARCQAVELELEAVRQELLSTRRQHNGELQQIEAKAANDIAQLTSQLASSKEQLKTVQFASIEASNARDDMRRTLHEKQSQFEADKKDWEHRIEQLKTENADALEHLSNDYLKRLESERVKVTAVIDEYESREQKSLALIEELKIKYEIVKNESRVVSEQVQHQSGQVPLNADVPSTPSATVYGASDVDSVLAHLSSQLQKVTRERDSAMQSLQTVYGDRIELQQTIKMLESERTALTTRVNHLDAERQSLVEQVTQARGELSRLKHTAISRSATSLSSVGTGSIPDMPSITDEADRQGPDVIDSLRAEFEELRRLRREKDRSSSSSATLAAGSAVSVLSHSEVSVNISATSVGGATKTRDDSAVGQNLSAGEAEETMSAEEMATMKQEYSALCAELVRLREMLITLQRVDHEREQVRSEFELEIRLLRDELLHRDQTDAAAVTENVEAALGDKLKERDAEIDSLKGRLAMTLSRMEELITEKDSQCAIYEHELEEVREEHCSALKRIDALVQEHNILIGGQVPLSSVASEVPIVIHSEHLESVDEDYVEDLSPKRIAYENQAKEIELLREQLNRADQDIKTFSLDRDRLSKALESDRAELLASLEKADHENIEQQQMYEQKLSAYAQDIEQLNRKLDTVSVELEQSKSAHLSEMEKLREEYQAQFNELSFSNDELNHEQRQELCAVQKQCAEMQTQLEQMAAEKVSMEQEYVTVMQDVTKENNARISALREDFAQVLAQAQCESEKAYSDHVVQLEEELNQCRQEIAQLEQSLALSGGGMHHSDEHTYETRDLEAMQVLQLRINDLTDTKDELQRRLDVVTSENERLTSEVETLQSEKEDLRSQVATLPKDYPHGVGGIDAESVADTSGDSHLFYTPSKSRKTVVEKLKSLQADKELLTKMVERLNAEKEQLKSHLITGHQPAHVFEADIRHLELTTPETVNRVGNSAEVRMIALESEKELLAGMLEKLSCENEQLIALMTSANDNVLDTSYDDGSYEEPELTTDEVIALRYEHAVLRAKISDLERQLSSVNVQPADGQNHKEKTVGKTNDVEVVQSGIQTDVLLVDEGLSETLDQSAATSNIEHLNRTVKQIAHERDVARSEMITMKRGICTIMDHSVPAGDSQQEMSSDSILAALDVFIHQAVEHENSTSRETISELQSQIAELHCANESVLTEVQGILSEIDPSFLLDSGGENQCVDVTECDALLVALRLLKEYKASADASFVTAVGETEVSQQALLLESVTEERDKLYRELENARRQLIEVLPYHETTSVDRKQTIGPLIGQINQLIGQKNEFEANQVESSSDDREVEAEAARQDLETQRLTATHQTLVDSSVQVDLQILHRLEGLQADDFAATKAFDVSEHDQSNRDLSLRDEDVKSQDTLVENVRTLEKSLSFVTAERDKLNADLSHVVQELVELKASQTDLNETTKQSIEALRNELDSVRSDREALAEREAAANRQVAKMKLERDELNGKIGALQDALTLAVEEKDQYIQSRFGAEAQLPAGPGSAGSVIVPAEMEYSVSEIQKSDEGSPVESNLVKNNILLQNHIKELEVVQANLLSEKEAVAEQYSKTVDELKARLVEMQATVESLQSEISVKSQENEAVVVELTSHLQAAETMRSRVNEENSQKLLSLTKVQSVCDEKQKIIDALTARLQTVIVSRSDDDDENSAAISLVNKVDFLQSEVSRLSHECDQQSFRKIAAEHKKAEALSQCEDGMLAQESQLSGVVTEETGTDFIDAGISELQQVDRTSSIELQCVIPQTAEQCTMTEQSTFQSIGDIGTAHIHEDVSALQSKLQNLKAKLEAVTEERDELASKLLKHSSEKRDIAEFTDLAVVETRLRAAAAVEHRDSAEQTNGLLDSEESKHGQIMTYKATDHKECYFHLHSRHRIAVSDDGVGVDVKNVTDESAVETVDAADETDVPAQRNSDDSLQVKIDELFIEMCGLKEERDEMRQKLLLAETCIQETQDSAKDKVKALEDELASVHEELRHFETLYKTLESEQQETAEKFSVETPRLTEQFHTVSVERDSLSVELESTKHDLVACKESYEEKISSAENCIKDLRSELAASLQSQQALTDELTICKMHLEETAGNEADLSTLTGKCDELEATLCTVEQERDAVKEQSITSRTQLEELKHVQEQTTASMKSKMEVLEVQLVALQHENMTLTENCNVAIDKFTDLKNSQVHIESELRNQIEDLQGQIGSLNGELEGARLSTADRKYEELQQSLACTSDDAASKLQTLSSELKTSTEEKSELTKKLADIDRACTELKSKLESSIEDRNSLMIRLREAESEQIELKKSVMGYQEALVNIERLEKECCRLNAENKCFIERCYASELARNTVESQLDDQQQRTSALQTENHELIQTKELLLSENGCLKQQISEYINQVNTFASSEQFTLEKCTFTEEQLLTKIKGLEADLSDMEAENGMLKSKVDSIPLLTEEIASITVERDDAHERCSELEAEIVKLRGVVEDLSKMFDVNTTGLIETKAELTQRYEEAECEVSRLKSLVDEKNNCVLDLKLVLARTQEELAESQKERESLFSALASERNAVKEQAAANEAAMSEVVSRLSFADVASSKSEQLEKEFALKCEELRVAEDQLHQWRSVQQHVQNVNSEGTADIEALQQECYNLRTLLGTYQLDANTAREKLSQMEGLCQSLTTERDELVKERHNLNAEKDEMSHKLMSLQQQLEQVATDPVAHETKAVESKHMLVKQLDITPLDDVEQAVNDRRLVQEEQNRVDGIVTSQHENQITEMSAKIFALQSELKTACETVCQLQEEVNSLQQENQSLQQVKQAGEVNLNKVSLKLPASQPEQALGGEWSSRSTEGCEELQTRLNELDAFTGVSSAADSTIGVPPVHASRTFTKIVPSDVAACPSAVEISDDKHTPLAADVKFPPGSLLDNSVDSSVVHPSRTFTKLVSTDTAVCQTDAEMITGKTETDVSDLYSQISNLQLELERQKLSQFQQIEKLQAECIDLAKARDTLLQENSLLNERLKDKRIDASSTTDYETISSQLRVEIEAETKQHYLSQIEALETEYQEKLMALKDECDRQVLAAENSARAKILECSPSETSVVESASSTDGDSTAQMTDIISQRDQLKSYLADKTKEVTELHNEIERLCEENEKMSLSAAGTESVEPHSEHSVDLDEDNQRIVANLESQLLMSTEENERLQQKVNELKQQADSQLAGEVKADCQQMKEQHEKEMKVLEFRLQQEHEKSLSHVRTEVEAKLEEAYQNRREALDAEFKKKSENFRKETEHAYLQELKKLKSEHGKKEIPGKSAEVEDVRDFRQQLLNEFDRMRHEYEALQEENVHLQSECERLSREAAEQQHRSAVSDEAEADANRDWRVVSNDQCKQPNVNVNVVNEGFVLSHYAEQLQERVAELERANRILQQRFSHSPAGSDQDICEGVFIDEKHRLEALRPRTVTSESFVCDSPTERTLSLCSREDAEISPVPSPDGVSGVTHSPSYERLKVEFVAYKQKAQKESKKLKARLASAVRENYELMKSNSALGESPSPSPVLRSPVSPVADILLLQSIGTEQSGTADRKRSTSGRHCDEKDVQTDLCGISKKIYALEATADSRAVEKITHSLPSGSQTSRDGREIDPTTSVGCRCKELEMELLVVQSQCLTLVQQNASLTEHIGCLRREAENQEQLVVTEAPAAAATDVLATDDTNDSTNHNLMAENRRLQQQRKMERSEYQEKMQLLEERCIQENAKLKQLLNAVKAGSDRSDEVSDGDTLSSCRHCAELADKCRMLETSVELSSLNAERRLHEAEESRVVAAHLQSRLDEFSEDDRSMLRTNLSGPSTACANVMDCRELSVDHTEMLATAGSGRVAIDDVEVSDDVRTPEAVVTVSADSLDHLSAEHLQLPALERNVDEGTASAVALTTSSVPVSDEVAVERPGLPETLESKCREQAEELDQQPAAAAALNTDVSDQLAGEYEAKLESLGEFQLEQLENVQVAIKEDLVRDNLAKFTEMCEDMEKRHRQELQELRESYEERIRLLHERLELTESIGDVEMRQQMQVMEERDGATVQQMVVSHSSEIDTSTLHEPQMRPIADEKVEELTMREMMLKNEIHQLNEQISELRQQHSHELERLSRKNVDEMQKLTEQLSSQRASSEQGGDSELVYYQRHLEAVEQIDKLQTAVEDLRESLQCRDAEIEQLKANVSSLDSNDGGLIAAIQLDLERASAERDAAQQTNNHLMSILSESVRMTVDLESRISQCIARFDPPTPRSGGQPSQPSGGSMSGPLANVVHSPREMRTRPSAGDDGSAATPVDASNVSVCSDEGLDVSQQFAETVFTGSTLDSDAEDIVSDLAARLQRSVERLLDRLMDAGRQVQDGHQLEAELRLSLQRTERHLEELTARCDDLEQQLKQETQTREFLSVEFYKADGLVKGYMAEKQSADERMKLLENRNEALIKETERLRVRVRELEDNHDDVLQREQDLVHQQQTLELSVDDARKASQAAARGSSGLMQENLRLGEEIRSMKKQMDRERQEFQTEIRRLEFTAEEVQAQLERTVEEHRATVEDYGQKIDALEKQLKSDKQFIEYQAVEREQERDEYHAKILQLEGLVRDRDRKDGVTQRLRTEIEDLEQLLREKTESYDDLESVKLRLDSEVESNRTMIVELREIIRHLETDLEARCKTARQQQQRLDGLEAELAEVHETNQKLIDELHTKSVSVDDRNSLQRVVRDLEEQLEAVSHSERLAQHRISQLEEELKNLKTLEEELMQDKDELQKKVCEQLKQLSQLRSQVSDLTLSTAGHSVGDLECPTGVEEFRLKVDELNNALEVRDKEVMELSEQLTQFQERLLDQTEDVQHANAQLDALRREKDNLNVAHKEQLQQLVDERNHLQAQLETMRHQTDSIPMTVLTQSLLSEKNNEIDELTADVERLNTEVDRLRAAKTQQLHSFALPVETQEALAHAEEQNAELTAVRELLVDKETTIDQLKEQVKSMLQEVASLNEAYTHLQEDYGQVELMASNKQKEVESLSEELTELRASAYSSELQAKLESELLRLGKEWREKQNIIDEKEEEMYELESRIEKQDAELANAKLLTEKQTSELAQQREEIRKLRLQLDNSSADTDVVRQRDALLHRITEQDALIAEMRAGLERGEIRQQQLSSDTYRSSDDDDVEYADTLDRALARNIDIDSEMIEQELNGISEPLSTILKKLYAESLHVLSLSDLRYLRGLGEQRSSDVSTQLSTNADDQAVGSEAQLLTELRSELAAAQWSWNEEKQSLLSSVESLKKLLAQLQPSNMAAADTKATLDWRADILRAVHDVFAKDLQAVHAHLRAYTLLHSDDGSDALDALERTISAQETSHRDAVHLLITADRRSLTAELNDVRAEIESLERELQAAKDQHAVDLREAEQQALIVQLQAKKRVETLEHQAEELKASYAELQSTLTSEREHSTEISSLLAAERQTAASAHEQCTVLSERLSEMAKTLADTDNRLHAVLSNQMEQQRENDRVVEQLTQRQAEVAQANNRIQLLENRSVKAAEEVEHLRSELTRKEEQADVLRQEVKTREDDCTALDELRAALDLERSDSEQLSDVVIQLQSDLASEKARCSELARALEVEQKNASDQPHNVDSEVVDSLRAALDVERSTAQQLTESLHEEQERVAHLTSELSRLNEQLTTQRQLAADVTNNMDSSVQTSLSAAENESSVIVRLKQLESLRQRLMLILQRLRDLMLTLQSGLRVGVTSSQSVDSDSLSRELNGLNGVLSELQSVQSSLSAELPANANQLLVSVVPSLNDSLLQHNSELTAYIGQLSAERQDLRVSIAELQHKLSALPPAADTHAEQDHSGYLASQLNEAQNEVAQLRSDLRRSEADLETERSKLRENVAFADKEKVQRLYGKYLRAESFRKALIYQKKYLLLLIGGFRDCEEETLAMIARMGAEPSSGDVAHRRLSPLSKFRSAARVIIAISRLKFVVKKWRRATRISMTADTSNSIGAIAGHTAATNGFASLSSEANFGSVTAVHPSLRSGSTRGTARERLHPSRSTVPPTPPTRDRDRLEPFTDGNGKRRRVAGTYRSSTASSSLRPLHSSGSDEQLMDYLRHLEGLQVKLGSATSNTVSTSAAATYVNR